MILDKTERMERYLGLHPGLDFAIARAGRLDLTALAEGRHGLGGDVAYLLIQRPILGAGSLWECHRRHIDLQIALAGGEFIAWAPVRAVEGWKEYQAEGDVCLSEAAQPGSLFRMDPGCFAVFFPEDAHRPCLGTGTGHKAVFKIRL